MSKDENVSEVEALIAEGQKLMESRLYERAMVEFKKAMDLDVNQANPFLEKILETEQANQNWEGFIAVGSNILQQRPDDLELANALGNAYRRAGNHDQAQKLYDHCLQRDPQHREALFNQAAAMAKADFYDSEAVQIGKSFEKIHRFILPNVQETEKLLSQLQQLLEEAQAPPDSEDAGASSDKRDSDKNKTTPPPINPKQLVPFLRQKYDVRTKEGFQIFYGLAIHCLQTHAPKTAGILFSKLEESYPANENLKCFHALALAEQGQHQAAINQLVELLGKNPFLRYANVNLGLLYFKHNQQTLGRKYFLRTQNLLNQSEGYYDMDEYQALGEKFLKEEQLEKAKKVYEVVCAEQKTPAVLLRLASILILKKDYDDVEGIIHQIQIIDPENKDAKKLLKKLYHYFYQQAEAAEKNRIFIKALEFYQKCLKIEENQDVFTKLILVCRSLNNKALQRQYEAQFYHWKEARRLEEMEAHRQHKIEEGLKLIKMRRLHKAISVLEGALRLKPDKDLFIKIARLYQKSRQADLIPDLTARYNQMVEREERLKRYQVDQEKRRQTFQKGKQSSAKDTESS